MLEDLHTGLVHICDAVFFACWDCSDWNVPGGGLGCGFLKLSSLCLFGLGGR